MEERRQQRDLDSYCQSELSFDENDGILAVLHPNVEDAPSSSFPRSQGTAPSVFSPSAAWRLRKCRVGSDEFAPPAANVTRSATYIPPTATALPHTGVQNAPSTTFAHAQDAALSVFSQCDGKPTSEKVEVQEDKSSV